MANRSVAVTGRGGHKPQVLLLMDSPRKADGQRIPWTTHQEDEDDYAAKNVNPAALRSASLGTNAAVDPLSGLKVSASQPESLGRLLVEMTAQVQDERSKRSDVEKRNQSLMLEIEQLQRELLDLKTSREQQTRRRASGDWDAATRPGHDEIPPSPHDGNADFWFRELQEAKNAKDAAVADAHTRAMEVMELNACISMQHDELKALRASEADVRFTLTQTEDRCKEMLQQHAILVQENQLLKDEVNHLNGEIGKRGSHFKALMDKWSESQAQCEHLERENRAMLDKMKELRAKHEQFQQEMEKMRDERDLLQHQANHLKGAVAAKAAESKAFQAYGSNARDHLQAQNAMIQRQQIFRRKVHGIAHNSVVLIKTIKSTLASVRAPLVTIQADFRTFLKNLKTPVMNLALRSRRYTEVAFIEHQPLRMALANAELTRRHLHEQLWRARRNALLVCQIRNVSATPSPASTADSILSMGDPIPSAAPSETPSKLQRTLRANYGTAELLLRESERDTVTVKCDALYSDRARGVGCWNGHESVAPLLQSVLDGYNACVVTFDGLLPIKLDTSADSVGVPELVLSQLFQTLHQNGAHFHKVKLTVSFFGVYNEAIYDLLGMDPHANVASSTQSMSKVVVLEVQNAEEALLVLRGGCENLAAAHELKVMDQFLTHKVITVCVVHENLLLSGQPSTKSKLQIVELATGPNDSASVRDLQWQDRDRVKAHVAMESGINALLTTLADVRVLADTSGSAAGGAFIRYHSSKLTVLLQDTVKPSAKFLTVAALPASTPLDGRAATATRWMFHLRSAVGSGSGPPVSGPLVAADRSVEGFINRFTQQSQADGLSSRSSSAMAFSSSELADRPPLVVDVEARRWDKEVEAMGRRYGDLTKFTTTFYQPAVESAASGRGAADDDVGFQATAAVSPRRPSLAIANTDQLTDVVIRPHDLVVADGAGSSNTGDLPVPAPVKTTRSKSKAATKVYRGLPGHRNGSKTAAVDKSKRRATAATVAGTHSVATLAPRPSGPPRLTSMVKLRRETASSALKKAIVGAQATPHHATTTERLQNRKTPFK